MSHAIDPARLVAALTEAGWTEEGRRTGEYIRFKAPNEWRHESLIVSLDQTAPEHPQMMLACLRTLEWLVEVGDVADRALTLATCSCEGRRWSEDENWQPDHIGIKGPIRREPGRGLIPCGFCNEGGWDVEPVEVSS